jgi:uncharacterized protein YnzC (UPF0291/DUF896 family)
MLFRGDNLKDLLKRINELAKKSKLVGLSEEEKEEQHRLRQEYIQIFRGNFKETLMNVKVVDEAGNDITPEKLLKEQNKNKNQGKFLN